MYDRTVIHEPALLKRFKYGIWVPSLIGKAGAHPHARLLTWRPTITASCSCLTMEHEHDGSTMG
jgi:hypothetical protein